VLAAVFKRPPLGQGGRMNTYRGPAKPIKTQPERGIFIAECVVFLSGILIVGLDVFVWRANIVL
jgi:hypothetical protein